MNLYKSVFGSYVIPLALALGFMSFTTTDNDSDVRNTSKVKKLMAPFHEGGGHSHIYDINTRYKLYNLSKNDIEGYNDKIYGRDYTYQSLREDLRDALISRASTGQLGFEIRTAKVPENYSKDIVTFFFYSSIDLNIREPFDVMVNGKPLLTFLANDDGTLKILDNPGEGHAGYVLVERDENKDGKGAFRLSVPINMLHKGTPARVKVQGHKKGSRSWFMVYKADDALKRLELSAKNEASFSIKEIDGNLLIDAPGHFGGKTVYVVSDGKASKKAIFKKQGDLAKASLKSRGPKSSFKIVYDDQNIAFTIDDTDGRLTKSDVIGSYFLHYNAQYQDGWSASLTKLYWPALYMAYDDFFDKSHEDGSISILNSSHQDIAWIDRPEVCIILRDTLLLTPIIKDAFVRTDYGFDIEDGLMLREYLGRHPNAQEKLTTLLNKKLISVGASYNCPYEDMYDGEDLVRQFYLGKKWVKKTFEGYDSKVYWNVDVPAKTLQFPQILKKAGVDYMVISRHTKGMFNWESPDGSSVFTYSPGFYGDDLVQLSKGIAQKIKYGAEQITYWDPYFKNSENTTPLLSSYDMIPAIDYSDFIEAWNDFDSVKDENGKEKPVYFPKMEVMTADEFMPLAQKNATNIKTIRGESPNVWVYIHGPAHHKALTASREASKLLPAAEKFLTVANILDPVKSPYPFKILDEAWQAKIYPDHGWGGHDGDITDGLFKEQLVKSKVMGENLLQQGTDFIANRIKTKENIGMPIVLFNSLSWQRTDPVTVSVTMPKGEAKNLNVLTSKKHLVPSQMTNTVHHDDGSIKNADVTFIAKDIPSIGYSTFYVHPSLKQANKTRQKASKSFYENKAYRITFEPGGISRIYDKELKRDLFKTDNLKIGEVFTMYSNGNGAGEFGDIQQPFMEDFDKVSQHGASWNIINDGEVFTTYRIKQPILHVTVEQDVTIYHELKRVLFETRLLNWNGVLYREFRTAFPVAMKNPQVAHEVPFGTVEVGKDEIETAGNRYTALCKDVHPRAIMDWISASDDDLAITLSSSVSAADWVDPTSDQGDTVLQHLLLASRTSCHWEGNEYSQEGNHDYHNILTSNKPGDMNGSRIAKQHNEPIHVVVNPDRSLKASLPEHASFFNINKENVNITAVKKAEDTEDIIVRMYDTKGVNATVKLDSFFRVNDIKKTNIIEENPKPITEMKVSKYAIETFSLEINK